mmetsp:Transcript_31833/g.46408  ORF Transcript_31833/g.46408 Transcript_31833/m.46408 type:complete len:183 (-) Transcript_31833:1005-1553(-)
MISPKFYLLQTVVLSLLAFIEAIGPVVTVENYDLQFSYYSHEQSTMDVTDIPALASSLLTVTDADSSSLTSATIDLASGFVTGDILSFTNQGSIVGSFDPENGILTMTGMAYLADWQAALRSVSFKGSPDLHYTDAINYHTKTLRFQVMDDSLESSSVATRDVYITTAERVYTDVYRAVIVV